MSATQLISLSCLIVLVLGFVFFSGFVCGQSWQSRQESKHDDNDLLP